VIDPTGDKNSLHIIPINRFNPIARLEQTRLRIFTASHRILCLSQDISIFCAKNGDASRNDVVELVAKVFRVYREI
jgi:hypothetical protein